MFDEQRHYDNHRAGEDNIQEHDEAENGAVCGSEPGSDAEQHAEEEGKKEEKVCISRSELKELKEMARERDEYLDRLRRTIAENMNMRNRMEKIRERASGDAMRDLVRKVLPLADSLARAIENSEAGEDTDAVRKGLELTEKEFYDILSDLGIEPIDALGRQFDPDYHDAVYQQQTSDADPNEVVGEIKKGFLIRGELLRPSHVVVAAPPKEDEEEGV